jgi:hypothetical protein
VADIDIERLHQCLSYDAESGVLRWKVRVGNVAAGSVAGCLDHRGYRLVRLVGRLLLAHRIAWALHYGAWPDRDLDHRNMDKTDNRIANLRLASRPHNNANTPSRNGRGLPKGCYQLKGRDRWYSQIRVDGQLKRLGTFASLDEAAAAFQREHQAAHGDFSRCGAR